jgi:hypothetical protein
MSQPPVRFDILRRTRLGFARRSPGLKGETWAALRVFSLHAVWTN